jgi:NADPH-dependent 2,4-dienoyl-CoA reductase/sulfur reductase-like enzyme
MFEGRPEDIAYCIRCNEGCVEKSRRTYQAVQCTVNPTLGFEDIRSIVPAEKKRKVAVIGGGPAGMEAAIVSTLRGHDVTIFEKRKLGGVLTEASMPDFKADIRHLKDYLCTQVEKLGIKVNFKEATPQSIAKGGFDAAVIAIGSKQASPDVHGAQSPMIVDALAVLRGEVKLGKNIVVVGAGYVGLELALYLGEKGKRVIVVECRDEYGTEYERGSFVALESRLVKCDVTIQTGRLVDSVLDKEVVVIDRFGKKQRIAAENVVFATGFEPQAWFRGKLASISGMPLFSIGDCVQPRKIFEAIHEGYMAGAAV